MKKKKITRVFSTFIFATFFLSGCFLSYQNKDYKKAKEALTASKYKQAVKYFDRVIKRHPESSLAMKSAREAAIVSLFHVKDFESAIGFYNHLVINSRDSDERIWAKKNIASIYFEKLTDYKQAIKAYNTLISLPHSLDEKVEYKLAVAKSYYHLNDFYQAEVEVKELLAKKLRPEQRFKADLFRGNILMTAKKLDAAVEVFSQLLKEYPELSKAEKVGVSLAVSYEELNEYDKAIATLEEMKKGNAESDFIDFKIKRLRERRSNLPGYRGYRK